VPVGDRASQYAEALDGLVLQGGADISPLAYGEQPIKPEWAGDPVRDKFEISLVQAFTGAGKPILGICRGAQLINVALGGSLHQDIPGHRHDGYDSHWHRVRLESRSGKIPVLFTCPAATEALRVLGAHRIGLIHPPWFTEEMNTQGMNYFRSQGFEVVRSTRISPARPFTEVSPPEVYEWTKTNVPRQAEAVFIGGNGLRAVGTIHALEEALGKPVLTANQVLLWQALRPMGVAPQVTHYGRVFTRQAHPSRRS